MTEPDSAKINFDFFMFRPQSGDDCELTVVDLVSFPCYGSKSPTPAR